MNLVPKKTLDAVKSIIALSSGIVTEGIIKAVLPVPTKYKLIQRVAVEIGTFAISALVGDKAADHIAGYFRYDLRKKKRLFKKKLNRNL